MGAKRPETRLRCVCCEEPVPWADCDDDTLWDVACAVGGTIYGDWASAFRNDAFEIAICDECLEYKLATGAVASRGKRDGWTGKLIEDVA